MTRVFPIVFISAVVALSGCNSESDFESVFNGKDLSGWVVKCAQIDEGKEYWYVEDGCLVANSMGDSVHDYIWLQYDRELADFHLKLKVQGIRGNKGNTGIQIRSRYDEKEEWLNGPQIDIHPPAPWRSGMMWDETRGYQRWIFPNHTDRSWVNPEHAISTPDFYYKGDEIEWNNIEVIAKGTKVTTMLNGEKITDLEGEGILNDSIHVQKQVGMKGYICLQIHVKDQLEVRFKDIALKEL